MEQKYDPLVDSEDNRYVLFPIKYDEIWQIYKKAVATFWTVEEINFGGDMEHWAKLNDNEKHFIKHVLAFFAGTDGIVMENLAQRFMSEIKIPEAKNFYAYQIFIEGVHSETYSLLIDTYIKDPDEKEKLFNAIDLIPCIQNKSKWAIKWIEDKNSSFATR